VKKVEKATIELKGHALEVRVGKTGIDFVETARLGASGKMEKLKVPARLGRAKYDVHSVSGGDMLSISNASITIDPKRFNISETGAEKLEVALAREAENLIFAKHKGITKVAGGFYDARRNRWVDAEKVLKPKRVRKRLARGKPVRTPLKRRRVV